MQLQPPALLPLHPVRTSNRLTPQPRRVLPWKRRCGPCRLPSPRETPRACAQGGDEAGLAQHPGLLLSFHSCAAGIGAIAHDVDHGAAKTLGDGGVALAGVLNRVMQQGGNGLIFCAAVFPNQGADADPGGSAQPRAVLPRSGLSRSSKPCLMGLHPAALWLILVVRWSRQLHPAADPVVDLRHQRIAPSS
jgi:hypothetical protein